MRIRIKTNLGRVEFPKTPWHYGEEHEVDDALGSSLIARGVAERCTPPEVPRPPKTVAAVPDKPAIADTTKPEIAGKRTHS